MTQQGVINFILLALRLDENTTPQGTPCMKAPLVTDETGDPLDGSFSYSSVVRTLLYLANNNKGSLHAEDYCPKHSLLYQSTYLSAQS